MSKATDMLTTMGGLRGPAAAPKGASHGADDMKSTVGLLRAMATGSDYRERKHDIILTAGADEIERLRAINAELLAVLEELVFAYNEDSSAIRQANAAIKKAKEQP